MIWSTLEILKKNINFSFHFDFQRLLSIDSIAPGKHNIELQNHTFKFGPQKFKSLFFFFFFLSFSKEVTRTPQFLVPKPIRGKIPLKK